MGRPKEDGGGGPPPLGPPPGSVRDARFAAMHTDPRFQRFPQAKRTLEIDKRFAGEHHLAAADCTAWEERKHNVAMGSVGTACLMLPSCCLPIRAYLSIIIIY